MHCMSKLIYLSKKINPFLLTFKQELPTYLAKVIDQDPAIDVLEWWYLNESDLPCWAALKFYLRSHHQQYLNESFLC